MHEFFKLVILEAFDHSYSWATGLHCALSFSIIISSSKGEMTSIISLLITSTNRCEKKHKTVITFFEITFHLNLLLCTIQCPFQGDSPLSSPN